jgi:transposase-like protein
MTQRRRVSTEYKREAVAMLNAPGLSISQIATEPGIGMNVLSLWQRELRQEQHQAFTGHGRSCDEEVGHLRQ